jgi:hypothetical protein
VGSNSRQLHCKGLTYRESGTDGSTKIGLGLGVTFFVVVAMGATFEVAAIVDGETSSSESSKAAKKFEVYIQSTS